MMMATDSNSGYFYVAIVSEEAALSNPSET
jgi:hypothetical protein